jgi:hypothetical protein
VFDGDKAMIVADKDFVKIAEQHMTDIVPLYYDMATAKSIQINNNSIYKGLITAYSGGNIGMISNEISKIWNSDNINLDAIKILCCENNFAIDYAKTLYKPTRPDHIVTMFSDYTSKKLPHFFKYAKGKELTQVEKINNSTVNRLDKTIVNFPIRANAMGLGKFDYKVLMNNPNTELDMDIVEKFKSNGIVTNFMTNNKSRKFVDNFEFIIQSAISEMLEYNPNIDYVVDVLVKYYYNEVKTIHKSNLWNCFGDVIIRNIRKNLNRK